MNNQVWKAEFSVLQPLWQWKPPLFFRNTLKYIFHIIYSMYYVYLYNMYIFIYNYIYNMGFQADASGKESSCQYKRCKRHRFDPWVGKITWRREWQPTPVFLPGKSHAQRSLVGGSPGSEESDTTGQLSTEHIYNMSRSQIFSAKDIFFLQRLKQLIQKRWYPSLFPHLTRW